MKDAVRMPHAKFQDIVFAQLLQLLMDNQFANDVSTKRLFQKGCGVGHVADARVLMPNIPGEAISKLSSFLQET